jgi:hypothetical protein
MKYLGILILLITVWGCSKEIENNKAIDGEWIPVDFYLNDYDGIKHTPTYTGTLVFNNDGKKSKTGTYDFQFYFDFNGSPLNFIEKGTYHIENKNQVKLVSSDGKNKDMIIVYKTKEDLVLDFPNVDYLNYHFVLKKIKAK